MSVTRDVAPTSTPLLQRVMNLSWPLPFTCLALGLVLAAIGEYSVESGDKSAVGLVLYVAAALLCLPSLASYAAPVSVPRQPLLGRRPQLICAVAGVLIAVLWLVGLTQIMADLTQRGGMSDGTGTWLWFISLCLTLAVSLYASGLRWRHLSALRPHVSPTLILSLLVVCGVSLALRLPALDHIPNGIQADEGDRAAVAMHVVRGDFHWSLFAQGWYYIPNLYFWILALPFKLWGIGFVQGRILSAVVSSLNNVLVFIIGYRYFNRRVAWTAALLAAAFPLSLEQGRLINEGVFTALLWLLSMLFLLEASRSRRLYAWAAAGISGALSIYFYPSGRLWVAVGAAYLLYHIVERRGEWRALAGEVGAFVYGCLIAYGPIIVYALVYPGILTLRAEQTTAFNRQNALVLYYYNPAMSWLDLAFQQIIHTVGAFNQFKENGGGGFFPGAPPLFSGLYAVLSILGMVWCLLRFWDRRAFLLTVALGVTLAGIAITVDTPDFIRFSAFIPLLPFFAAIFLDHVLAQVSGVYKQRAANLLSQAARVVAVAVFAGQGLFFYFGVFPATIMSDDPNVLGQAVATQKAGTFVIALTRQYHMINVGWVELLAPNAHRGEMKDPGYSLPLAHMQHTPLTFVLLPDQLMYLPYLRDIYPRGWSEIRYDASKLPYVTLYHVPDGGQYARSAVVGPHRGIDVTVDLPGMPRPWHWRVGAIANCCLSDETNTLYPYTATWHARLRAPVTGLYGLALQVQGQGQLIIDGKTVLALSTTPDTETFNNTSLHLTRGLHDLRLVYHVASGGGAVELAWQPPGRQLSIIPPSAYVPLTPRISTQRGPAFDFSTQITLF